ncbi:MAG TPA: sugar transferase [Candidatus Fournierella pullicola]|uniref:Sugar transferase n=1 Tax=Candidatus Allofournierella pullicola TaxID=2838596 RepID=A0A9D2AEA0_9FIRM|nr:sugar transferase [Candidatus Fournierella pullicola]
MRKHQWLVNTVNFTADVVLILVAYALATWLRNGYMTGSQVDFFQLFNKQYALVACVYAVCIGVAYVACRLYGSFRFRNFFHEARTIAMINGVGILGVGAVLYIARLTDFSRLVLGFFYVFSVGFVLAKRLILRGILRRSRSLGYTQRDLIVVGEGDLAARYIRFVEANARYGYRLKGYVSTKPHPEYTCPRLCGYDEFSPMLSNQRVDQVVFALSGADLDHLGSMIAACGRYGAKASVIPQYNDFIPATPTVEAAGSLKLINVRSTPDKGPVWAFVKRAMDLAGASVGLVLASPIILVTAIAVKRCDGGPAIFAQERMGKNGVRFKMYKFRSMYMDAEERLAELQKFNQVDGPAFKMENDPRITPVGRFIRKTSIDELPQLINILKGEMSIVGPRPPIPREVEQYTDWDWGRLAVKPGLTCYWQVSGRSNLSFDEWMKLDLKYVEEQGFLTDMKILFKTVGVVLRGDGAY